MGHFAPTTVAVLCFNPAVQLGQSHNDTQLGAGIQCLWIALTLWVGLGCQGRLLPAHDRESAANEREVGGLETEGAPAPPPQQSKGPTTTAPTTTAPTTATGEPFEPPTTEPPRERDDGCSPDEALLRGTSNVGLRRLSSSEREGTLRALLGDMFDDPQIADRLQGIPADVMVSAGELSESVPAGLATVLAEVAKVAAERGLRSPTWRASLAPCAEEAPVDDACAESVIRGFGARVWRRELTDDEVDEHVQFYARAGGGEPGLALVIRRLLQSPALVFHVEATTGKSVDERLLLTDFEVASRIAYRTTDAPPDDELLQAARSGELRELDAVAAHVARLLDSERARLKVLDFVRYYGGFGAAVVPAPEVSARAGLVAKERFAEDAQREALAYFEHVVFEREGTFAELMLEPVGYAISDDLARVFGVEVTDAGSPSFTPSHPGWLHRPALLLGPGHRTNVIARGAHVRKLFLCTPLPLPDDANAVADAQTVLLESDELPNRQAVQRATSAAACQGCHSLINPLGFAFEAYDQLGMPRDEETILDRSGDVAGVFPIDTRVEDPLVDPTGPEEIRDSVALAEVVARSQTGRACIAQRFFEFYRSAVVDTSKDACAVDDVLSLGERAPVRDMIQTTIANRDIFYRADTR